MARNIEKLGFTLFAVLCLANAASAAFQFTPLGEADCLGLGPPREGFYKPPVADDMGDVYGSDRPGGIHGGMDFRSPDGTSVFPMADGIVVAVKTVDDSGAGCWVAIRHEPNVFTMYAHLQCASIANLHVGDPVSATTSIAKSDNTDGNTNTSTGPHLHLEFWNKCAYKFTANGNCWAGLNEDPPPQAGGGPRDPRCLFSPQPPEPPPLDPITTFAKVIWTMPAWFPHDPNAMIGPEGYVIPGQVMSYTVQFENEGTGTAFDVYITDIFDNSLDDSNIVVKDFYLVDWATNIETPTTLPYNYDPQAHKLTVFAGTFDSRKGGKFTVELRLKPDVPQGTGIKNYATVYFPTVLEETATNSIISVVPQPASVEYVGSTTAAYSSYVLLSATVSSAGQTLLGKTVNYYIGDSSFTAVTGGLGDATIYPQVDIPPGNYPLTVAFPGDGYYYTSSTQIVTLQVLKAETFIADFSTVTYSTTSVLAVAMTNSKGGQILNQDTSAKTISLQYRDGETWTPLGQALLSSGTAVFQFALPQQSTTTYNLKAMFAGDDNYLPTESTATLTLLDGAPPITRLSVLGAPLETGATAYIFDTDFITITAEDTFSGTKDILYALDMSFSTQTAVVYSGPFTLPAGAHTIYYTAVDNTGNQAAVKTGLLIVSVLDIVPPVTVFELGGARYNAGSMAFISVSSGYVVLNSTDAISGVSTVYYKVNPSTNIISAGLNSLTTAFFDIYTATFSLQEGIRGLAFGAVDKAGNYEQLKSSTVYADGTPPETAFIVLGSTISAGTTAYITAIDSITLVSADTLSNDVRSGVAGTCYLVDKTFPDCPGLVQLLNDSTSQMPAFSGPPGTCANPGYMEPFTLPVGTHTLHYMSFDRVANFETAKTVFMEILPPDVVPPVTTASVSGIHGLNGWYISPVLLTLTPTDAMTGVQLTMYELEQLKLGGEAVLVSSGNYVGPLNANKEGGYYLHYNSIDRAGNIEQEHLTTLKIDLSTPFVTVLSTPLANSTGWNNTPVSVTFTGTDTISAIAYRTPNKLVDTEGQGQEISGYFMDYAGWSSTASVTLNIDTTPPNLSYLAGPAPNEAGWNNTDVTVNFTCADNLSGMDYCPDAITLSAEGVGISTGAAAYDRAGNTSEALVTGVKIDKTAPESGIIVLGISRADGAAVIIASTDTIGLVASDTGSGVAGRYCTFDGWLSTVAYTAPFMLDVGTYTIQYTAVDAAGNQAVVKSLEITVPPVVLTVLTVEPSTAAIVPGTTQQFIATGGFSNGTSRALGSGDGLDWTVDYSSVVVIDQSGLATGVAYGTARVTVSTDAFSAFADVYIAYEPSESGDGLAGIDAPEAEIYVSAVSTDTIPLTEPVFAAMSDEGLSPVMDSFYYFEPSGVLFTVPTKISFIFDPVGLDTAAVSIYYFDGVVWTSGTITEQSISFLEDGRAYVEGYITHTSTYAVLYFQDLVPPVTEASLGGTAGQNGWYVSPVTVGLTSYDKLTGAAGTYYSVDSGTFVLYSSSFNVTAEGDHLLRYYSIDNAGNQEAEKSTGFKIDLTAPEASAAQTPPQNAYGWNNTAVSVTFSGSDAVSDIAYCSPETGVSVDVSSRVVSGYCMDYAGWSSSASLTVNIDLAAPESAAAVTGDRAVIGGRTYISVRSRVALSAADPLVNGSASGVDQTLYRVEGADTRPQTVYSTPFGLEAGGRSVVYHRSTDRAGNAETEKDYELWLDTAAPVTSAAYSGGWMESGGTAYINQYTVIFLNAEDPVANDAASGVMLTKYRLDDGGWRIYAGSFSITVEGRHALEYYSLDNVLNAEQARAAAITVDNTPPVSSISIGEPKSDLFGLTVITPETPITLAAADQGENVSGLSGIVYQIGNGGQWSQVLGYLEPFRIAEQGTFMLRYWSVDNVGNAEPPKEMTLAVSTLRQTALTAVDGLDMTGNAEIAGAVNSSATVALFGNARILGDVTASTITLTGKAEITGQKNTGAVTVPPDPIDLAGMVQVIRDANDNGLIPAEYLPGGVLKLDAKADLTLSTGVYYFKGMHIAGASNISVAGPVEILVEGNIIISGGSSVNSTGTASALDIYVATDSVVTFTGGGNLVSNMYAPYSVLKLAGNALLGGHYFVKYAAVSGTSNMLQAGESLPQAAASTGGKGGKGAAASAVAAAGVPAGPDPAFRLGEVYVFPNPARGGAVPVFHMEFGVADKVTIKIYTVSGRPAHEHTITGAPEIVTDANGQSYAYRHAWQGHIPSGVYYYFIEAEKAGKKLKRTGKFAVVR